MEQPIPVTPAPTPATPAVTPPAEPVHSGPGVLSTYRKQRAEAKKAAETPAPEPPKVEPPVPVPEQASPLAATPEPPEPPDEGEELPPAAQLPKGPEPTESKRWKDPDSGVTLDLRRRDHRRIKRLLEERSLTAQENQELRSRLHMLSQQGPQPPNAIAKATPSREAQPDPNDPEPTLEQFADQADPYGAYIAASSRWHARQEFRTQHAQHASVERVTQVQQRIDQAQDAFDAKLPEVRTRYADFDDAHAEVYETLGRIPPRVRATIIQRLLTSKVGHDLAYYLGTHPEDLRELVSARSAYEQALTLGAIETRVRGLLNAQKKAATTPAPLQPPSPPMAPVHGGATTTTYNPKTASLAQHRAWKKRVAAGVGG